MVSDDDLTPDIDTALADWEALWLPSITSQVFNMQHRRQLHDEFVELLSDGRPTGGGIFEQFFHQIYLEAQTLSVRRQCDKDSRTLSLRRLVGQLEKHRADFTRVWYVDRWMEAWRMNHPQGDADDEEFQRWTANHTFDAYTDLPGDDVLGHRRLQKDRAALLEVSKKLIDLVNRTIAHADGRGKIEDVTYAEFHAAMDYVAAMFERYYLLISRSSLVSSTPVVPLDWLAPFWNSEDGDP